MRIRHWAGYGCVNARRINDGAAKLHIRVEGVHEQGLIRSDSYDLYNWLVKRFDQSVPDVTTWLKSHPLVDLRPGWRNDPKLGCIDTCDYYFTY